MNNSPNYSDHLIDALRCLDDDNLRKLAHEIMGRLAQSVLDASEPSDAEILATGAETRKWTESGKVQGSHAGSDARRAEARIQQGG